MWKRQGGSHAATDPMNIPRCCLNRSGERAIRSELDFDFFARLGLAKSESPYSIELPWFLSVPLFEVRA
jgi:hypothetical protein